MKEMGSVSTKHLMDFSKICDPLIKYIRKTWEWRGMKPKGYDKFMVDYEADSGNEAEKAKKSAEKRADKFGGINDETACSFSFPHKTSLFTVYWSDTDQGRDPLHTLMCACVAFGLNVGEERALRKGVEKRMTKCESDALLAKFGIDTSVHEGAPHEKDND